MNEVELLTWIHRDLTAVVFALSAIFLVLLFKR